MKTGVYTAKVDAEGTLEVESPFLHPTRIAFTGQGTATVNGLGLSVVAGHFEKSFTECYPGSGSLSVDAVGIPSPTLEMTFDSGTKSSGIVSIKYGVLETSWTFPSRGCE